MDQEIRNKLRNVVTQCRRLLEDAISQELEGKYTIFVKNGQVTADPNAKMANLTTDEDRAARKDILDHFSHIQARGFKPKDAFDQLVREIAFTHLNRLCAYKMMEAREVYVGGQKFREAVSRGFNSNGMKFYRADHPHDLRLFETGQQETAYRHFLDWLGAALSEEIGVLFNPNDPANRLYPRQRTLDEVLDLLNGGGIKAEETELGEAWPKIWSQDETIGWVYQYFTPKELRDQARKESAAPRNSYELAFRNQFFTPRYVVEFLTDNTLGRTWYEMRKGETKLKDQCRYMVRRPTEMFLKEGEQPPKDPAERRDDPLPSPVLGRGAAGEGDDLSQEDLLKLPVYIPHRPKKDPRELKILDPACGSGHFLLYCFDLLLTIYEEAYADPNLGPALQKDYPTLADLRRDVPRLILAHNLHGIDIDLRATQIAALALWLRCQRAYREMGLKQDRPKITKSNIVCAEPMPGEREMLDEFLKTLKRDRLENLIRRVTNVPEGTRVRATESMVENLTELVRLVWDRMQLAGEAGSLLKIEEELQEAVREGQEAWEEKLPLFRFTEFALTEAPKESYVRFVPGEGVGFWQRAEALVLEALRDYARHAANGGRLQRQLFAEDAEHGFAFIDTCQKQYDVVLMNPPFGDSSKSAKAIIEKQYPRTKNDLFASFVERGMNRLRQHGLFGAITSRTGFFLSSFQKWREEILLDNARMTVMADLGQGVLDTAMVETAAYCLTKANGGGLTLFFRLMKSENKSAALNSITNACERGKIILDDVFQVDPASFGEVPGSPFAYWVPNSIRAKFTEFKKFEGDGRSVRLGLSTKNDIRFVRLHWEISPSLIGRHKKWITYANGGVFSPFYCSYQTAVLGENNFEELGRYLTEKFPYLKGNPGWILHTENDYTRPCIGWPLRTHSFSPHILPAECVFSARTYAAYVSAPNLLATVAALSSKVVDYLLKASLGRFGHPEFVTGVVRTLPWPMTTAFQDRLSDLASSAFRVAADLDTVNEISRLFCLPVLIRLSGKTLSDRAHAWLAHRRNARELNAEYTQEINQIVSQIYSIGESKLQRVDVGIDSQERETTELEDDDIEVDDCAEADADSASRASLICQLISHTLGCALGRWDVRYATGEMPMPKIKDPFDALPVCSPGMLRDADGLPATLTPFGYSLRVDGNGIIPDDPDHPDDIVRRVREVLELIWKNRAEAIEKEACEILGVKELRDYFRKPGKGGFWDDHVSRYSKSRRKAPIYWLLQSAKKNYALWLYYHRLDDDILFKALHNYVKPKIRLEQSRLDALRSQKAAAVAPGASPLPSGATGGRGENNAKKIDKEIERQEALIGEIQDFADKLERAARLNFGNEENLDSDVKYDPDLNDGVVLNIAPLWELVPWKEAKKYWEELLAGMYEWSSMGMTLRKKGLVK
jgi:hypothetical protein